MKKEEKEVVGRRRENKEDVGSGVWWKWCMKTLTEEDKLLVGKIRDKEKYYSLKKKKKKIDLAKRVTFALLSLTVAASSFVQPSTRTHLELMRSKIDQKIALSDETSKAKQQNQ